MHIRAYNCNHRRSRDCERAETSIECLRCKFFRDDREPFELREKSEAKLISRLNSGRLKPKPAAESGVRGNEGDLVVELLLYREGSGPFCERCDVSGWSDEKHFVRDLPGL